MPSMRDIGAPEARDRPMRARIDRTTERTTAMDQRAMSTGTPPRFAIRWRTLIARRPSVLVALHDVLREQDDLAYRALCRRRHGDGTID